MLEEKKLKTGADKLKLAALQKELGPIQKFLSEAKQQRDAILTEIGMNSSIIIIIFFLFFSVRLSYAAR